MSEASWQVGIAREQERTLALSLVLEELEPSARVGLIESLAGMRWESLGPLDALVVARREDEVLAAVWAQPQPGEAASLWPPRAILEEYTACYEAVVETALRVCDSTSVALTQCLLGTDDSRQSTLERCGFEQIADLVYLGRTVTEPPTAEKPTPLRWRSVSEEDLPMLGELIEETYIASMDCPELGDRRNMDATLVGYRAIGVSGMDGWLIAELDNEPVGAVLTARHEGDEQAELVYMGLIESARGRGLGGALIYQSLATAFDWGAERLVTAADSRNQLARRAYQRAGFAEWNRRRAMVRFAPRST